MSTALPASVAPLRRTETGYLVTELHEGPTGLVLCRWPGERRTPAPCDVGEAATVPVTGLTVPGVSWSAPRACPGHPGAACFEVPGPASVATLLLGGMAPAAVATMLDPVGLALAAVHGLASLTGRAPAGLVRLHAWLATGEGPGAAAPLHRALAARPALHRVLVRWTEEVRTAPARAALGSPGQNTLYPAPDGSGTTVLVTDEVGDAPPEWDLGWLLGELVELLNPPAHVPEPRSLAGFPPADALRRGYPAPLDEDLLARTCLLRWTLHLHDYAAYVDWDDDLLARLDRIAALASDLPRVLG